MSGCRRYALLIAVCLLYFCSTAQTARDTVGVDRLLSRLSQIYSPKDSIISFHVTYVYANEARESGVLDSVSGFFELNRGRSHSILDNTESITNDSLSVTLFREEKVMYLSKIRNSGMLQNPVTSIHNLLQVSPDLQLTLVASSLSDTVAIVFPPGLEYKSIRIVCDRSTGLLQKVIYVVKTEQLVDPTDAQYYDLSKYDDYAKVTASFSNYRKEVSNNVVFDNSRYFIKEENEVRAAPPYSDYKVYIGSAGL